jgi:hypothetical protein
MIRSLVVPVAAIALAAPALAQTAPAIGPVLAAAKALGPQGFQRTTTRTDTRNGNGKTVEVDRFDPSKPAGKQWTLLSVDGKAPTPDQISDHAKTVSGTPVPGYYRIASMLAGPNPTVTPGADGTVFAWKRLPAGSLPMKGMDLTADLAVSATVSNAAKPMVTQMRVVAPKPFRVMMLAKIDTMTVTSDYIALPDGTPFLSRQVMEQAASIPMKGQGTVRSEMLFQPLS